MTLYQLWFKDTNEPVPPLDVDKGALLLFRTRGDADAAVARHTRIHERPCEVKVYDTDRRPGNP